MSVINDSIHGRRYRRQITVSVLLLFIFCRLILPTRGLNKQEIINNNSSNLIKGNVKKEPEIKSTDIAGVIIAGIFVVTALMYFESSDSKTPEEISKQRTIDQYEADQRSIRTAEIIRNEERNQKYIKEGERIKEENGN